MDDALVAWLGTIERLLNDGGRTVLWFPGPESGAAEAELERVCRTAGVELRRWEETDRREPLNGASLVLLDGEPNYFYVSTRLRRIAEEVGEADLPVILIFGVGWPYARRDGYPDPEAIPAQHAHRHRRGGLLPWRAEPVPGEGFAPDREHALLAHPFRNGRLTAVEDFLRERESRLHLQVLPGFHGLAVVASPAAIEASDVLRVLFESPGAFLLESGHLDRLEWERVTARLERAEHPAPALPPGRRRARPLQRSCAEPPADHSDRSVVSAAEAERLRSLLAARETQLRRLSIALLDVRGNVVDLLESNRWRIGDRIGDLFLKVRGRGKTETAADRLLELFREVESWGLAANLRAGVPAPPARQAPEEEAPRPELDPEPSPEPQAVPSESAAVGLFHRLAAGADLGDREESHRQAIQRSDRIVASVRRRRTRREPLVSIVMPTRGRAHLIGQAVTSVLEQTHQEWELIVCEDGTTAGTREALEAFGDPRIRHLAIRPSGAAAARNRALEAARGDWLAYLDDDNVWHPAFLEVMVKTLRERPAYLGAFCGFLDMELEGGRSTLRALGSPRFDYEALGRANSIDLNTLVHHRCLYERFGGFDEELPRHQDWDLVLRYGFVTDLLPVDALLCLYRRNREWGQITSSEPGDRSWKRVRESLEQAYREGTPTRVPGGDTRPVTLLIDGDDPADRAEAEAIARGLSERREVRLLSLADGEGADGAAAGGIVLVLRPSASALETARVACGNGSAVLLVVGHRDGPEDGTGPAPGEMAAAQTLTPEVSSPARYWFPPVAEPTDGLAEGEAVGEGDPILVVGEPSVELLERLEAQGMVAATLDTAAHETPMDARARCLLVSVETHRLGTPARRAVVAALAAGLPIVALPSAEMRSLAEEGCAVLAGGGAQEVVDAVAETLANGDLVERLAVNGRRRWSRRYSPKAAANTFDLLVTALDVGGEGPSAVEPDDPA